MKLTDNGCNHKLKRKHVLRFGQRQKDEWHSSSAEPAYIGNGYKVVVSTKKSKKKLLSTKESSKEAFSYKGDLQTNNIITSRSYLMLIPYVNN